MSEAKHSPEPWDWETESDLYGPAIMCGVPAGEDGECVVSDCVSMTEDDARRIVACVNACAGIPTEALEAGALDATLNDAVWVLHSSAPTPPDGADAWVALMNGLRALGRAK